MKRIVFLIIASLLVLGLVLPGCADNGEEPEEVIYTFEDGKVIIGICADSGHTTGDFNLYGILLAEAVINGGGGISIGGVAHNLTHVIIDTDEGTDETGVTGAAALQAAITADNFDILMGSFRTEAVEYYREVAMTNKKVFFDAGAATEMLQHAVVTNYDKYKYWLKTTPYNEHFLAMSVLKLVNSVALVERTALGLSANATLRAVIISENLKWARDEQAPAIAAGLPALNIALSATYYVSSLTAGDTIAALADIDGQGYNPHIIIPLYSGYMGIAYDTALAGYAGADILCPMSVGINVMEQFKSPWTSLNASSPGPYCAYHCLLDTWAEGLNQTAKTYAFLTAFMGMIGDYPLYTAATYDACNILKACLESVGYLDAGVGKVKADDLIGWYENPLNAQPTTTGSAMLYPPWDGTTTYYGDPALNKAQKESIYGTSWTYHTYEWLMPPNTSHDLAYGVGLMTGLGAQWQWDAGASLWKKVGIWPRVGCGTTDQYGDWDFAYPGTQNTVIPAYVTGHSF